MRSGSSLRRYSPLRSCARLSGPPVMRTADRGSGLATSGMAGLICCAMTLLKQRRIVDNKTRVVLFIGISFKFRLFCSVLPLLCVSVVNFGLVRTVDHRDTEDAEVAQRLHFLDAFRNNDLDWCAF